ncbi:hypothetical protein [Salinilacihabitans rarus]|uniref:hypothetical protein n=1 Tax=Salinilacihabitans rarus TaxID=2961596 RepID=UPI0020C895C3|nr:hypothetical protein [Salinilacihabitans rarus]
MDQDLKLYTLIVTASAQTDLGKTQRQRLAEAGVLGGDQAAVEHLATEAGDQTVRGYYRGRYAAKMAQELDELSSSSGFEAVPLAGVDSPTGRDGYYAVENADIGPPSASTENVQEFTLSLSKKGRRASHFRAVEPTQRQLDHEFGTDTYAYVAAPTTASKVLWFDPETKARERPSPVATRSAELADVDVYDPANSTLSTSDPLLVYQIDYADEELVDCRVYDTRGFDAKHDADGGLQWAKVFSTEHDVDAEIVLDNGLLRLRPDETAGTMGAETWDDTAGAWSDTGLAGNQPATVTLLDVDLTHVGMVRDVAQLLFDVDGSLFALNATVAKGYSDVLFGIPENETGPIPTDLETWLSSIASPSITDPNAAKTLVARAEVRR